MGTAIALREQCNPVPGTPTDTDTLKMELQSLTEELGVEGHLTAFGSALKTVEAASSTAHYFLLELEPETNRLSIRGYGPRRLERANADYLAAERNLFGRGDAVLVSADSLADLKRAYPNYFADTHLFLAAVRDAIA